MTVTLAIQVAAPIDDADRDLISAVSMLLFALGQSQTPPEEGGGEVPVEEPPPFEEARGAAERHEALRAALPGPLARPCMKPADDGVRVCVSEVGHRGRHLYRRVPAGMVN